MAHHQNELSCDPPLNLWTPQFKINISEGRAGFPDRQRYILPQDRESQVNALLPANTRPVEEGAGNGHSLWLLEALQSYSMEKEEMESKIKSPVTAKLVKNEGLRL